MDIVNFGRTVGDALSAVSGYENKQACISLDMVFLQHSAKSRPTIAKQPLTILPSGQK